MNRLILTAAMAVGLALPAVGLALPAVGHAFAINTAGVHRVGPG